MGRSPCCDKIGIKKGPWTPEEDIVLVSYIEKHGPRNWRTVPANTGLMRCSKSCRLRWTNYLRPGIKRGNFTTHEEGMIIHLQALLGNRWAAIASYLPQRTDNDIKNYWNTHLKKRIKKHQAVDSSHMSSSNSSTTCHEPLSRCYNSETRNADTSSRVHSSNPSSNLISSSYAASAQNISKLLEAWIKSSPKSDLTPDQGEQHQTINTFTNNSSDFPSSLCLEGKQIRIDQDSCDPIAHEALKSYISYENTSGMAWEKSSLGVKCYGSSQSTLDDTEGLAKRRLDTQEPSFTSLEKWLLDEDTGRVDLMDLSPDCCSDEML